MSSHALAIATSIGEAQSPPAGPSWPAAAGSLLGAVASVEGEVGQAVLMRRRPRRVPSPQSGFAGFRFPPDVIMVAVRWYLRYNLSYRDVEELLVERGIMVDRSNLVHTPRYDLRKYRWERTVNPSADAFQGSNP
jgi:hypothetical protein